MNLFPCFEDENKVNKSTTKQATRLSRFALRRSRYVVFAILEACDGDDQWVISELRGSLSGGDTTGPPWELPPTFRPLIHDHIIEIT